jgi:hypothetical protein
MAKLLKLPTLVFVFLLATVVSPATVAAAASDTYQIEDSIVGNDFFNNFDWFTDDDPTHGRVDYVSMQEAKSGNLSFGEYISNPQLPVLEG